MSALTFRDEFREQKHKRHCSAYKINLKNVAFIQ